MSETTVAAGIRSRCPQCDHPNTNQPMRRSEALAWDEIRHLVIFECDRGHCWSTSWTTEAEAK